MKIGILGCGYVGQAVALFLKQHGHAVSATTRSAERFEKLQTIVQDLHLISQPKDLVPFLSPLDVLLVCAVLGSSDGYRSAYLELAENVVQALPQARQLHQIIYTGSTSVYGECGGAWVNEESLPDPLTLKESGRILLKQKSVI